MGSYAPDRQSFMVSEVTYVVINEQVYIQMCLVR